jgi:hypothetical protein
MVPGLLDEISDKATSLIKSGQARTPEEATDLAIKICCSDGSCDPGLGGFLTDAWNALTGKPQSWYTNVSNIQNQLSVLLAGVTAVGQDAWNNTTDGTTDYNQVTSDIQAALTAIIVTTSHVPDDATIANAQSTANTYQAQLNLVQAATPDLAAQVQADQAQVQSMLPGPMTSPSAAGQAAFEQELSDRANALLSGLSIGTGLVLGAGALFLLWYFFGR